MFSSPRDMAAFLSANLGEAPQHRPLLGAMEFAQRDRFPIGPRDAQALAWEIAYEGGMRIVEKHGGLNNSSTYIGMIPSAKIGVVILGNRGNQFPGEIGRRLLLDLARRDRLG
jgi:CubicO group peptidase (beta-lactamase class C family)